MEASFLSIFLAPIWHTSMKEITPINSLGRELIRWLALRVMIGRGLTKLLGKEEYS